MRALLALCLLLSACRSSEAPKSPAPAAQPAAEDPGPLPRSAVRFETEKGPWTVQVEVADTPEARMQGLMHRRDLAPDAGMLFVFEEARNQSFWMHDTYLSLDMIFIGEDKAVAGVVANARPLDDSPLGVGKPSRWVVEVKAGEAAAHGVVAGTRVVLDAR